MALVRQKLKDGNEIDENVEVFDIDSHHFFAETLNKGKTNDHNMHNTCLEAIILHYKTVFLKCNSNSPLHHVIVWSDNAPHQYRCRQTFLPIASVMLRHTDPTALAVFRHCHERFEIVESKWKALEKSNDSALLNKGRFGMDC